jgi:hypothetical protein
MDVVVPTLDPGKRVHVGHRGQRGDMRAVGIDEEVRRTALHPPELAARSMAAEVHLDRRPIGSLVGELDLALDARSVAAQRPANAEHRKLRCRVDHRLVLEELELHAGV